MRPLRGNAALIARDLATGQEYVYRLPAPMRLGAPRRVQARFVEESLDRSVVNVVTVGNPVYEVTGRFRFVDRPQEWLDLISMAADQRYSLTYVRDLSRSGDEWQVVVIHPDDAVAVEPDPDRFAFAEYEATVVMRSSQPWGSLLGASDVLFRYHAGAPGLTTTRSTPATYRDRTVILRTAGPGVLRLNWQDGRPYALVEGAGTNLLEFSSDFFSGWGPGTGLTVSAAASIIDGQVAARHTNEGTGASRNRSQVIGEFSGDPETFYAIVENVDAIVTQVALWDRDNSQFACRVSLNWSTGGITVINGDGTPHAIKLADAGPNGGPVYLIGLTGTGPAGRGRSVFIYPTGTSANTNSAILHHGQLVEGGVVSAPIVTAGAPATRDRDLVSVDYHHAPGSCAVLTAGREAGLGMVNAAYEWQIGASTDLDARSLGIRHTASAGMLRLWLGSGSARTESSVPVVPMGAEYQRLGLLDVDEATAQARVRLMQRWREGGAWVDADGGWSSPLDVSELLAAGWESPHLTIGNVREGTRAGRLVLSDMVVVRGAGHGIDSLNRRFIGRP